MCPFVPLRRYTSITNAITERADWTDYLCEHEYDLECNYQYWALYATAAASFAFSW